MNILSIDGGGVRGIIPITILKYMEEITGKQITELFDSGGGTSTGGIIWGLLSYTENAQTPYYSMGDIDSIFTEEVSNIFPDWSIQELTSLKGTVDQRYSRNGLLKTLDTYIGGILFKDTLNYIVIPAYDIENHTVELFQNWEYNNSLTLKDVLCSTSAAPTYFEPYKKYIDGGVCLNNPTKISLIKHLERNSFYPDKINIVSIGTGYDVDSINVDEAKDWGLIEWAKPLFDIMMDGQAQTVHLSMASILKVLNIAIPTTYMRIQMPIPEDNMKLDDSSEDNIHCLKKYANKYIKENEAEINKTCEILLR